MFRQNVCACSLYLGMAARADPLSPLRVQIGAQRRVFKRRKSLFFNGLPRQSISFHKMHTLARSAGSVHSTPGKELEMSLEQFCLVMGLMATFGLLLLKIIEVVQANK